VLKIAHRGASGRFPENTLRAFEAAIAAGVEMCELDVQLTRDGELVVIHDDTVNRTTNGTGTVRAMTLRELKTLDAGSKFGAQFANERIPTLEEVLTLVSRRCGLNIEIKARGAESKLCALIGAHLIDPILVSSFDWDVLTHVRRVASEIPVGLLASRSPSRLLAAAVKMKADAINPRFDMVTEEFCVAAHQRGMRVYAWTVDALDAMQKLIAYGVDGIVTNYPERIAQVMAS
jgi:glycerophosphoryl diester phosphodiesterase